MLSHPIALTYSAWSNEIFLAFLQALHIVKAHNHVPVPSYYQVASMSRLKTNAISGDVCLWFDFRLLEKPTFSS